MASMFKIDDYTKIHHNASGENIANLMKSAVFGDDDDRIAGKNAVVPAGDDNFAAPVDAGDQEIPL